MATHADPKATRLQDRRNSPSQSTTLSEFDFRTRPLFSLSTNSGITPALAAEQDFSMPSARIQMTSVSQTLPSSATRTSVSRATRLRAPHLPYTLAGRSAGNVQNAKGKAKPYQVRQAIKAIEKLEGAE